MAFNRTPQTPKLKATDCPACFIGNGLIEQTTQGYADTVLHMRCQSCDFMWTTITTIICTCEMSYELAPYRCRLHPATDKTNMHEGVKLIGD